jgi:adenylate cyclase
MAVYAGFLSLALLFAAASLGSGLSDRLSSLVFDEYQRLNPRTPGDTPIVIVDIDEDALAEIGQWPWPRSRLAVLVDRLGEMGAAAIAFDIVFSEKDRTSLSRTLLDLREAGADVTFPGAIPELDNDAIFAGALKGNPSILGFALTDEIKSEVPKPKAGFAFAGRDPRQILPSYSGSVHILPEFYQAAHGLGFFSFPATTDGVVRKMPLIARSGDELYPTLGMESLRVAQQAANFVVKSTGASGESEVGAPAIVSVRVGALEVPTDGTGRLWLYYSGRLADRTISASDLLVEPIDHGTLEQRIAGNIVLVGTGAVGLRDLVVTPLGYGVPGVVVHAEMLDQILSGTYLHRPDYMPGLEYFLAAAVTLLLMFSLRPGRPVFGGLLAFGLFAGVVGLSWYAFAERQMLLDPLLPSLAAVLVYIAVTVAQYLSSEREKRFIRNAFGRYLAPSLVARLSDEPEALKLGGELKELTLLFCDIRGFTSLSENLEPEKLTKLLNDFLTPMTDELLQSGATIDKYMGDAIMAFWNAPLPVVDHRAAARRTALAMMRRLDQLNAENGSKINIGIGLNTGECCVGNLGSLQRFNYSAIGDAVNVAARIESITKAYGLPILFADTVLGNDGGGDEQQFVLEVDRVRVVGREEPLVLYTVFDRELSKISGLTELASAHSAFLEMYRRGDFDAAGRAATSLQGGAPPVLKMLYRTYLDRLDNFRANPPANWDGVFTYESK